MRLPEIELDDRRFQDLVSEADLMASAALPDTGPARQPTGPDSTRHATVLVQIH